MTDTWRPEQYNKFQREREQPFVDLVALVRPLPGMRIADLGCGTGRLTRRLHEQVHAAETIGIDRSDRMLAATREEAWPPGLTFEPATIESFLDRPDSYDLIFSNAVFHWLSDHESLLRRLTARLSARGQLAFQVPAMQDDPTHTVATELSREEPFCTALGGWHASQPVLAPEQYARVLFRLGFVAPSARLIVYPHVLECRDEVVEWVKGTLLAEYEKRMPPDLFAAFIAEYRERLLPQFDAARPFFYPFKRILCWGERA